MVDAAGTGLSTNADCECLIQEWRCVQAGGAHPWSDFEALAHGAVRWISRQPRRQDDELLLLGTAMPQEIGLGIGAHVHGLDQESWPDHLYPLVWDGDARRFVIPRLDLGWESLHRRDPAYWAGFPSGAGAS